MVETQTKVPFGIFRVGILVVMVAMLVSYAAMQNKNHRPPQQIYITHEGSDELKIDAFSSEEDANNSAKRNNRRVLTVPFEKTAK